MRGGEGRGECWCVPVLSQVEGLQLSYKTPKRVVLDSMREQGVIYNMLVFGGGRHGAYIPVATYGCDYSEEEGGCVNTGTHTHTHTHTRTHARTHAPHTHTHTHTTVYVHAHAPFGHSIQCPYHFETF